MSLLNTDIWQFYVYLLYLHTFVNVYMITGVSVDGTAAK